MDTRSNTEASSFESASTGERDVKSLLVTNHFVPASVLCATSGDRTACNALGNLCVLSMYDKVERLASALAAAPDISFFAAHWGTSCCQATLDEPPVSLPSLVPNCVVKRLSHPPPSPRPLSASQSSAACARYLKQYSTADKFVNDFPSWSALPRSAPTRFSLRLPLPLFPIPHTCAPQC